MADSATDPVVKRWLDEISLAQKDKHEKWVTRGKKVIERYRDERTETELNRSTYKMNILWSNVETLKPAIYAQTPNPVVQRRNKDRDPVGKWASTILERCLAFSVSAYDFDYVMREAVTDYLLPGRGEVWAEYRPVMRTEGESEYVDFEYAECSYVHWRDFLTNPARTWKEVWWVAKRDYLTRDEIKKNPLFKDVKVEDVTLDHKPEKEVIQDSETEQFAKATVWTVWSKRDGKVYYIAPGYKTGPLAVTEPPLSFDGFFPCPRPLTTSCDTDSIIPIPDYAQYQDQAEEIDLLTQRIGLLTKALKVVGVYDAQQSQSLSQILGDGTDNKMIPVDNWAMLGEKGGLKGVVDWVPIEQIVKALEQCYLAREQAKQALYEVTGIGDIIRGATDPDETARAQEIKSQWGSLRVRDRQREIQRFARDIFRLKAEIIAEQFSVETLKAMSNVKLLTQREKDLLQRAQQAAQQGMRMPPIPEDVAKLVNEPTWEEVVGLLKNEKLRGFQIEVETDSTIQPDENAERENRVQLVTAVSQYLPVMGEAIEKAPESAEMMGEFLMFVMRGWRGGEQLEPVVEQFVDAIKKRSANPQPPQPTPDAQLKAQTEKEVKAAELAQDERESQREAALEARDQDIRVGEAVADKALEAERMGVDADNAAMDRDQREREMSRRPTE